MTQQQTLETMAGVVSAVNENGLKLEGRGDAWLNFTKLEWRGHFETPQRGDSVKLGMQQDKNGKWWVKTCEIQSESHPRPSYEDGHVPAGGVDLRFTRQTAMKNAAYIVAQRIARGEYDEVADPNNVMAFDVCAVAEALERHMLRENPPFD
jgi:hypothetical protein